MELPYANLQIQHWNPGAEKPLVLPVHLICNTSDEEIFENIRQNSRLPGKVWQKLVPAHDRVAVLCGSGPSLADHLSEIRERQSAGQVVFAMNGAAKYLSDNGILADYQVIIDARPQTATLIGPAKQHLFASQVSPVCFEKQPDAMVWHLQVGNIEALFPEYNDDYCLIGGAASVGNTSTCLAYAMGYRDLQIYGFDSSHRGENGHAFRQSMNDGDPCCVVMFGGKEYTASLTMKLQAEKFQETSKALQEAGCKITVHGDGLLPAMFRSFNEVIDEAEKYRRVWSVKDYRTYSPGEEVADKFLELVRPRFSIIDFGCGTGRAGLKFRDAGCYVTLVDFADNCRDEAAMSLPFVKHDLREPLKIRAPHGFCTDVLEHIQPEFVDTVIRNIMKAAPLTFFQISTVPDSFGVLVGKHLHLSVHPHKWWREKFEELGYFVKWQEMQEICSSFLVEN